MDYINDKELDAIIKQARKGAKETDLDDFYREHGLAIYIKGVMVVGIYPDNLENNIEALDNGRMRFEWRQLLNNAEESIRKSFSRDDVVARAKEDIESLISLGRSFYRSKEKGNTTLQSHFYSVDFVVKPNKRKVTALVNRTSYYGGHVNSFPDEVGRAVCLETDCFNVHIGKAIALRRALGLEVPEEYFNAPQPTGVQVGDVVYNRRFEDFATVIDNKDFINLDKEAYIDSAYITRGLENNHIVVVDDSARYE
ncbi:hypothetical protein [Bacillus mojavensis]